MMLGRQQLSCQYDLLILAELFLFHMQLLTNLCMYLFSCKLGNDTEEMLISIGKYVTAHTKSHYIR